jgi:L-threonylcarbamoyladenylate synthase
MQRLQAEPDVRETMQTQTLRPTDDGFNIATDILTAGGLVAFPTETVYGLGGDACNGAAVAGIYAAKGRPSFNPLIVHVADLEMAKRLAIFDPAALELADKFWPGPLTLVLPLRADSGLSELVTAGLGTVAIRVPAHPVARALLAAFDGPIAAPSANPSGGISPTRAAHVRDGLGGRIDAVINGGKCAVGLESTIVMPMDGKVRLLRSGGVPAEEIANIIVASDTNETAPTSPGQLASHYAPNARLRMNAKVANDDEHMIGFGDVAGQINLSSSGDLTQAAANLFAFLHMADEDAQTLGKTKIAVAPIPMTGLGIAINDRLKRASAPRD